MSRRKKTPSSIGDRTKNSSSMNDSSTGDHKKNYEVGYRRPPTHSQFRPGESGNPAGRRKGVRNLETDVKRMLSTPIKVKEGGRTRKKSTQEGGLMVLREKALRGDARALDRFIDLAVRFNNAAAEIAPAQMLGADDQAILAAYVAQFTAAAMTSATGGTADDSASKPGAPRSGRKVRK